MAYQEQPRPAASGQTEVFRIPSADSTLPDIGTVGKVIHPSLSIIKGPHTGITFDLDQPIITVGRDPSNSVFLNDMTVSRRHARIDLSNAGNGLVTIEDLGSLNGTWVDGAIINRAALADGATIQIGTFRMVFHANGALGE
ncbi:MAG: FHA domain-containing protein [Olsenella sp.]|nr:FHA domain-containing protein [Olsenella sp.]